MRILWVDSPRVLSLFAAVDVSSSTRPPASRKARRRQCGARERPAGKLSPAFKSGRRTGKILDSKPAFNGPWLVQAIYQASPTPWAHAGSPPQFVVNVYDATTSAASARIAQHIMVIEPSTYALQIPKHFCFRTTQQTFQDAPRLDPVLSARSARDKRR